MRPAAVAATILLACGGGVLPAAEPAHDHGAAAGGPIVGTYSTADLAFLTHMIVHHRQALELCTWVEARSEREAFHHFARLLSDAQQAEIDQMAGMLRQAAARGATIPEPHFHADPPMAGMLSKAQMAAIERARGAEFERLWLEGMILHHRGAVDMALAQQEAQFRNRNQPFGLDTMVDEMLAVQRGEIGMMTGFLATWR